MTDDRRPDAAPHAEPTHTTTVIERRGSGGGLLIGLAVLIAVVVGAYVLLSRQGSETRRDDAIAGAARDVGDAARDAGAAVRNVGN